MSDISITMDELLAELERTENSDEGFTTKELRVKWEVGDVKARALIEAGLNAGRLRRGKKWGTKISGVRSRQPCWIPVSGQSDA